MGVNIIRRIVTGAIGRPDRHICLSRQSHGDAKVFGVIQQFLQCQAPRASLVTGKSDRGGRAARSSADYDCIVVHRCSFVTKYSEASFYYESTENTRVLVRMCKQFFAASLIN